MLVVPGHIARGPRSTISLCAPTWPTISALSDPAQARLCYCLFPCLYRSPVSPKYLKGKKF